MNKTIRNGLIGAAAIAACVFGTKAHANTNAITQEERAQHVELFNAIESVGVTVTANERAWCETPDKFYGVYMPFQKQIVICQLNSTNVFDGTVYTFDAEDLDTLRHEAHHLIQDCLDGKLDARLEPLFSDEQDRAEFLANADKNELARVRYIYASHGADEHMIVLEQEAFTVAAYVPANVIADGVTRSCKYVL